MDERGDWSLARAYDLTYAYHPGNEWLRQHLMSVNVRFESISEADQLVLADQFEVPDARGILRQTTEIVSRWPEYAERAGISEARTQEVEMRLAEVREDLGKT